MATGYSFQDEVAADGKSFNNSQSLLQDSSIWAKTSSSTTRSSPGAVCLPPLRGSAEPLEVCLDQYRSADTSVLRQTRKAELISCVLGHNPCSPNTISGLLLNLELKEQQLATKQHHCSGHVMLEGWVDDVLSNSQALEQQSRHGHAASTKGAAAAGLARQQLLSAGLTSSEADQLYRSLFVYSMGFVDAVKGLLGSNENRQELLQRVWRAFLILAEHCMKATFKSDYLALVNAAGTAMTELLCTKQALSEAHTDNTAMIKDLGTLSAAEAEATAQRRSLKTQVDELSAALAKEQAAHRRAVQQYVDAMDAKSDMQLQLEAARQALSELTAAHGSLTQQHVQLQQQHSSLVSQCTVVRDIFKHVDAALSLDAQLAQQLQQWQLQAKTPGAPAANDGARQGGGGTAQDAPQPQHDGVHQSRQQQADVAGAASAPEDAITADTAADMQPLAERLDQQVQAMYASWRAAVNARDVALTERFRMADQLRAAEEMQQQMQRQHKAMQQTLLEAQQQLSNSQANASDLTQRLAAAHELLAQHQLDLAEARQELQETCHKAAELNDRCSQLEDSLQELHEQGTEQQAAIIKLQAQLTAAAQRLGNKHRVMAEISKGFAVAMQSVMANQTARAVSDKLLKAERAKGAHMSSSLNSKESLLHDLQAQVREQASQLSQLRSEAQLLEATLQDSQRQAISLGSRLNLTEAKNDELLSQTQVQLDQLAEAATRINKLLTKQEQGKQQLDEANKEIKELKDAVQASERIISEGKLLAKSLTADVARITREKQVAQERAETTQARLELEVQRLSGQLSAAERKLELLGSDLAAERDRAVAQAALLERKRGQKRRWKEAYHTSAEEIAALHTQLLSQHKALQALEQHLAQLHTELLLLGIGSGGPAANTSRPGTAGCPGSRPSIATPAAPNTPSGAAAAADLSAARKAHAVAAEHLGQLQEQCLALDEQTEALESEQQLLLLGLVDPNLTKEEVAARQAQVAAKRTQLQDLRGQRALLETSRGVAATDMRKAEAALRNAHHARLQQRQQLLEQQAVQASDLVNAAAMAQLASAEEVEESARSALSQQLAAYEAVQADHAALLGRMQQLQVGIDTYLARISGLEGDKAALEQQLQRSHATITCLQAEVSAVNSERERIRSNASQAEDRIIALEKELDTAKQAVTLALKGMEAKHAAERQLQEQRLTAERAKATRAADAAQAAGAALRARIIQLRAALADLSAHCCPHACVSLEERALLLGLETGSGSSSSSSSSRDSSSSGGSMAGSRQVVPHLPLAGGPGQAGQHSASVMASGAGRGVCVAGERWVFSHHPEGPWRRARQLLVQHQHDGHDALMRQSSSIPGTPRASSGRTLGLPPSLPGLALTSDLLLVLIGELLLHKIDADTASDDRLLLSAGAAAAGLGTASSSVASSRAASRPATAGFGHAAAGSGSGVGSGAGGVAAAAAAAAGALLGVVAEEEAVGGPVKGGTAAAVAAWWATRFRKDLEGAVYDFFLIRCGCRLIAEAHCSALVSAVRKAAGRSKRVALFGRCLGLLEPPMPPAGVGVLLHFLAQLHSLCGPLVTEATEGSSQVMARTAGQVAMQVLQPTARPPCQEVTSLVGAITAAAGGSSDSTVDVDAVMELLAAAWSAQRAVEQQHLERMLTQADAGGKSVANLDEFAALAKQASPLAGQHLHQEQISWLFASALAASCPGATAVSAAGFSTAVLDAGLVGSAAHLRRHPAIAKRPAFSDSRLLTMSWQAVRPSVKEVLRVLPKAQPALAPEASSISSLVQKLDEALSSGGGGGAGAADAWQLYRRVVGFYSLHGSFPEAASVPVTPRTVTGSGSGTPRPHAEEATVSGAGDQP